MQRTKFLIVDDDPEVHDLIPQILPDGEYELLYAIDGAEGIQMVSQHKPDLVMIDLVMPGLSGNDMLVGIKKQAYSGPIIVTTKRGAEQKAIEAFRLGATDFLTKPLRPPEVVAALDRALEDMRLRGEKARLMDKLQTANAELENRVKELTLLSNIGRLLTGMQSIDELFETVLASMLDLTGADHATVIVRDPTTNKLVLSAGKNLTLVMQEKLGEEIRDEVAELVLTSREPLVASGEGLQRFKVSREIHAVVYVPMIAHGKPIGVLTVGNHKKRTEFSKHDANLLKAMADYVAIGLTNARLFSVLDMRARTTEQTLKTKDAERAALVEGLKNNIYQPLLALEHQLGQLTQANLPKELQTQLLQAQTQTQNVLRAVQDLAQTPSRTTRGIYRISPP